MKKLLLLITGLLLLFSVEGQILRYSNYTATTPPSSVDLLTGLVSYWGLDEASAPAVDLHGSYDGVTWVNSPIPSEASKTGFGTCVLFTNADQESINTSADINPGTNDWSISFWFKINTDTGIDQYCIAAKYTGVAPQFYIMVDSDMHLNSYFKFDASAAQYCKGNTLLSIGIWYHGVISVDRDGNATVYLNGEPDGTLNVSSYVSVNVTNSYSFKIGGRIAADDWGFDGWIDEVALWYRALTQTEVTALYNSGNGLLYSSFE